MASIYGNQPRKLVAREITANTTLNGFDLKSSKNVISLDGSTARTVTLPTPIRDLAGTVNYIINDSSADFTFSCTGGFVGAGDSVVVPAGTAATLQCICVSPTIWRWSIQGTYEALATAAVQAIVEAAFTGNTETGITAAGQGDGTVDLAVAYGTTENTACEGDDARLPQAWDDVTPTLVWVSDTAPADLTVVCRGRTVNDTFEFKLYLYGADGDGCTLTSIDLGETCADIGAEIHFYGYELVDTTKSNPMAYMDTAGAGLVVFKNISAMTNACAYALYVEGTIELAGA